MNKLVAVVLVLGAAAGGFAFAGLTKHARSATPYERSSSHTTEDAERVRVVERVLIQEAAAPPPPSNQPSARPSEEPAAQRTTADEAPSEEERRIYADAIFAKQAYDAAWAPGAAQRVSAAVSSASIAGVRLQAAQCKTNLCKVDFVGDSSESAGKSIKPIVRALKWGGSGMAVMGEADAHGNQSFSLYLARGDAPLPEPTP